MAFRWHEVRHTVSLGTHKALYLCGLCSSFLSNPKMDNWAGGRVTRR